MQRNERGFTLAETLIVFAGFLIISSVCLMLLKPHDQTAEKELFIKRLKADLYYAQQYAILHQRNVNVNIMGEKNYYYINDAYTSQLLTTRNYSQNIQVSPGSMPTFFQFLSNGNVNRFGSFYIDAAGKRYKMTIQIGKGRFYIVEE